MAKNKLYNQSYFCKRIVEEGFNVIRLKIPYEYDDLRKWTIIVNKQNINYKHNILITCFKDEQTKEFSFKFQGQKFDDFILPTLSMKLIIDILKKTTEIELPEQKEGQTNE
jgi:hypothetical protein